MIGIRSVIYSAYCELDNMKYYFLIDPNRTSEEVKYKIIDGLNRLMELSNESGKDYIYRALNIKDIKEQDETGVCEIDCCEAYEYALIMIERPYTFLEHMDAIFEGAIAKSFPPLPNADETLEFLKEGGII